MAAQTLSEYFIEYRNGVNPVTGEQRLYKDITDQMIWDAAIKAAEEKFNPSNNGMELTSAPKALFCGGHRKGRPCPHQLVSWCGELPCTVDYRNSKQL